MTFYYSMKQMLRSPLKSFLFFLLMGVSAFFLALGGNLWNMSRTSIQEFEKIFTTIGTVEQTAVGAETGARWDAGLKAFQYSKYSVYGERVSEDVLDFEGADYLLKPRQRPYFGAYVKELYEGEGHDWMITVEVTPEETAVADHAVKMKVLKVLEGNLNGSDFVYVCEHTNPAPDEFVAGKTYVMQLSQIGFAHGLPEGTDEYTSEYQILNGIESTQYTLDGERVFDEVNEGPAYDEVTDGFYETARGKRWLAASGSQDYYDHTVPVRPVDGIKLLMPFYRDEVVITEGRDITAEEYKSGKKVCLIPDTLAMRLGKSLGDELNLPLYYANYALAPTDTFSGKGGGGLSFSFLNAQGQLYSVFNEQDYEIVGIYTIKDTGTGSYGIGRYEVVIPWNAVPEDSWKDNIVGFSRMRGATTSFQIANGTIQEFMEKWEKQGIDDVKITFYDKGYTELKEGIENRKLMSWIFLVSGGVMSVMILLFFSNLFITDQQERIAVERLLGRTKRQCSRSILTGLLVIAAAGCILGSIAGWKATGAASKKADTEVVFDKAYSNQITENTEEEKVEWTEPDFALAAGTGAGLFVAAFLISAGCMWENLKKEPLQLLGGIEE